MGTVPDLQSRQSINVCRVESVKFEGACRIPFDRHLLRHHLIFSFIERCSRCSECSCNWGKITERDDKYKIGSRG